MHRLGYNAGLSLAAMPEAMSELAGVTSLASNALKQEELFPIREVSRLTGVNPVTLRAWERRYGLIQPTRTDSGHRLYSQADIDAVRSILAWIEQLDQVDVEGVEPMTSNVAQPLRLRDDVVTDGAKVDAVLSNAPKSADGFFVVPKVVE